MTWWLRAAWASEKDSAFRLDSATYLTFLSVFLSVTWGCQANACSKVKVKVKSLSRVRLLATPWTVAYQASQSMEFSRQEYWSGVPLPSPGDLLIQGLNLGLLNIAGWFFTIWATREAHTHKGMYQIVRSWFRWNGNEGWREEKWMCLLWVDSDNELRIK